MTTLISTSDHKSLFQKEASTRVCFFKIFVTPIALVLPNPVLQIKTCHNKQWRKIQSNNNLDINLFKYQPVSHKFFPIPIQKIKTEFYCSTTLNNRALSYYDQNELIRKTTTYYLGENNYKLIRPLLYLSRIDISLICKKLRIPLYPDKSNLSLKYSRNRIRKQLLPSLKLFYNPQIEQALFKFAEFVSKEQDFIGFLVTAIPKSFLAK